MDKKILLLLLFGLISFDYAECMHFNSTSDLINASNYSLSNDGIDCITFDDIVVSIKINYDTFKTNDIITLNTTVTSYTDSLRNRTCTFDNTSFTDTILNSLKRNDNINFSYLTSSYNNITNTTYICHIPYNVTTINPGDSIYIGNANIQCTGIPTTSCYQNISATNVSVFYNNITNITVDCRRNITTQFNENTTADFYDNISNTTIKPYLGYKRHLAWNVGVDNVTYDPICDITAYGVKSNPYTQRISLNANITDSISKTTYVSATNDECPWKLTNTTYTLFARNSTTDTRTNTTFVCEPPQFPENVTYGHGALEYFNEQCTNEEKLNGSIVALKTCVERLSSPEVWTERLNQTQTTLNDCYDKNNQLMSNVTITNQALSNNSDTNTKVLYIFLIAAISIGVVMIVVLIWKVYQKYVKSPQNTLPPMIGGKSYDSAHLLDNPESHNKKLSNTKEFNKEILPEGYEEG